MVCLNCDQRFPTDKVNVVKGGCNPAPLKRSQHVITSYSIHYTKLYDVVCLVHPPHRRCIRIKKRASRGRPFFRFEERASGAKVAFEKSRKSLTVASLVLAHLMHGVMDRNNFV